MILSGFNIAQSNAFATTLRIVTTTYPPSEYIDETGTVTGIHVDVAKEAFKRMGISYTITFYPWRRALKAVYTGTADAIIDPAYNEERAQHCFFPKEPSAVDMWCLFQRNESSITIAENYSNVGSMSIGIVERSRCAAKKLKIMYNSCQCPIPGT